VAVVRRLHGSDADERVDGRGALYPAGQSIMELSYKRSGGSVERLQPVA